MKWLNSSYIYQALDLLNVYENKALARGITNKWGHQSLESMLSIVQTQINGILSINNSRYFDKDPDCYSAVNNRVFKIASELGGLALKDASGNKLDLLDECLISSNFCEAMKADDKVKVNYIFLHNY